jgi:hypothetical protein
MQTGRLASSFRDPSGFVFNDGGILYRQVNQCYETDFLALESSGLYAELTKAGLLIPHTEMPAARKRTEQAIAVIRPERVPFISYPYEWCFSEYKDAALLTLEIQARALAHGMVLKDASAYNVQFLGGKPVFIDTLSFEIYEEGRPWIGYRQFCQHFLAPLALMAYVDPLAGKMMSLFMDGIPLPIAAKMLPFKTKLSLGLKLHLHMHAKTQANAGEVKTPVKGNMSKTALLGLIHNLRSTVSNLKYEPTGTVWANYTNETNYSESAHEEKQRLVSELIDSIQPKPEMLWDLGANTGEYSRIAAEKGIRTIAWDMDPAAVEQSYLALKKNPTPYLLPLVQDLSNPSPSLGWANGERDSFEGRGRTDVVMALALIHHLAIGNNVPLGDVAAFFASLGEWLIVEFVPKEDSQTQRLLQAREDVFPEYTQASFEAAFSDWFEIQRKEPIGGTQRTLYLCRERSR